MVFHVQNVVPTLQFVDSIQQNDHGFYYEKVINELICPIFKELKKTSDRFNLPTIDR